MKSIPSAPLKAFLACFLALAPLLWAGCAATDEADNASVRPWNAPKNWETGIPSGLTEGR
jgi:hypothetical protein